MFTELVSSRVQRRVAPGRGLVVAALHGILIAGAIQATTADPPAAPPVRLDTTPFIYERIEPVSHPEGPPLPGGAAARDPVQLPTPPVELPTSIPPVTEGPAIDPARLRQALSVGGPGPARGESIAPEGVLAAAQVDQPAEVIHQPPPRYPPVLQQAGVEGRVVVEFVIDTAGHPEPASLRVLESSNAGFNAAAGETLRRSAFRPARVQGRAVRQRTIQSIVFRITPG